MAETSMILMTKIGSYEGKIRILHINQMDHIVQFMVDYIVLSIVMMKIILNGQLNY